MNLQEVQWGQKEGRLMPDVIRNFAGDFEFVAEVRKSVFLSLCSQEFHRHVNIDEMSLTLSNYFCTSLKKRFQKTMNDFLVKNFLILFLSYKIMRIYLNLDYQIPEQFVNQFKSLINCPAGASLCPEMCQHFSFSKYSIIYDYINDFWVGFKKTWLNFKNGAQL